MSDEQSFLDAIIESPDDDAPRLMYADWLTERGDPRGEFIRLQCRLAKLAAKAPTRKALQQGEAKLLAKHEGEWLGDLAGVVKQWRWERGFVDEVTVDAGPLLKHAEALWGASPIRRLHVHGLQRKNVDKFAGLPQLARLRELGVIMTLGVGGSGAALAIALASCHRLVALEELSLEHCLIGTEGAVALAAWRHVGRLRALHLGNNNLGEDGLRALSRWRGLASVRNLNLTLNGIGDDGVAALMASPHLGSLCDLTLSFNGIGDEGASALAAAPRVAGLEVLNLYYNRIGHEGAEALASSRHLGGLKLLHIGNNAIRDRGARALAESPHLRHLDRLIAYACFLRSEGKAALRKRFGRRVQL